MARTLTAKQAAYRDARVSGLGPADAYRTAYDASKMSLASVVKEANRLEKHPQIAPSIAQSLTEAVAVVEERRQDAVASAAWVIEQAVEAVQFGFAKVPMRTMFGEVIKDETGEPVLRLRDAKTATTNLALLSKMHPEFSDKLDARVLHGIVRVERGTRGLT